MQDYRVTWTIDVTADSPEEAARIARDIQQDAASLPPVFDVDGMTVDLMEGDAS